MAIAVQQDRKILVLKDEPSIRNLLTLMKKLGRENELNGNRKPVPAATDRNQFDAAILDLRYSKGRTREEVRGIRQLRLSLVGRQLVVTVEVNGPKTLKLVERYLLDCLPSSLLWLVCHR